MRSTGSFPWRTAAAGLLLLSTLQGRAQLDCLGVDGGPALPGTACDDGDPNTGTDEWSVYCTCVGYCDSWMGGMDYFLPGTWCDDGDPNTTADILDGNCICQGCPASILGLPGAPCDDGDPLTVNDVIDATGTRCQGSIDFMSGQVFLDLDGDGTFNGADLPIANRVVHAGPGQNYAITDADGGFFIQPPAPGFYTLTPASGSFDTPAQVFPAIDLTVPGTGSTGNALAMDPVSLDLDLSVRIMSGVPRPGFWNHVHLICKNEGTLPAGGTLTLTFDAQQTIVTQEAGTVAGNTITWTVPILQPGEVFKPVMTLRTLQTTPLGTVLAYSATVATTPADALPANDTDNAALTVVGGFDPNDMQVGPASLTMADLAAGALVTYTIRFQNTGTFAAENVRIADVLPLQLKQSSFELVASSHPCQAQIAGGLLQFRFDGIMLPDSTSDEPGSHGWVVFRMKPQPFLTPGASVHNSADIYFDLNDPVGTGATFAIELTTGVPQAEAPQVKVWPNPARDRVNVSVPGRGPLGIHMAIIDVNGRIVLEATGRGDGSSIPVSGLPDGLYMLRIGQGRTALHTRFVKGG